MLRQGTAAQEEPVAARVDDDTVVDLTVVAEDNCTLSREALSYPDDGGFDFVQLVLQSVERSPMTDPPIAHPSLRGILNDIDELEI